jgi:type II secretory ATPase GspE/PulE/Tfp pilus assembly ATPase PilB-like protein
MDVVNYITQLINQAVAERASDLHFEPQREELLIRQRVDGFLLIKDRLPKREAAAVISRLKVMADLDIGEKRLPQDGTLLFPRLEGALDIRVSTLPTLHGEKVVLRLFRTRMENISFAQLGLDAQSGQRVLQMLQRASGLLVVTGPTGAGKTTTLYAMLQERNTPEINMITLEDPVELQLDGVNQVSIQPKAGLTFARGLRSALRQDPDVIMIGEIRDRDSADIAIGAALTGHLVISSLHTADAAGVITRLYDMQIEPYRIAAALSGVIAQRLFRLLCQDCQGEGCLKCQQTGYYQRSGIFEVCSVDEQMERMIAEQQPVSQIRQYLRQKGVLSLAQLMQQKVVDGLTSEEEYWRVMNDVELETVEIPATSRYQSTAKPFAGQRSGAS